MPSRLETLQRLICSRPTVTMSKVPLMPLTQTASLSKRERIRQAKQDPYRTAQALQRKNAHLQRCKELKDVRDAEHGEPIWGKTTPFIKSLESVAETGTTGEGVTLRSHYVTEADLEEVARTTCALTKPIAHHRTVQDALKAPVDLEADHMIKHARAVEAIRRITDLSNAGKRDRFHINVQRIIDEFGRHNTDGVVMPKSPPRDYNAVESAPRAGPDTGSSEVQIAILTTKIRNLATTLATNKGYRDIHNTRNLRLMLHRRQKLLKYMEKRERGSGRWTNMLEKLGLTTAMWKGQISMRKGPLELPN